MRPGWRRSSRPDGVILAPRNSFSGRFEIEADLQNFIDRGGSLTTIALAVTGDTVTATQEVRQPQISAFGIDRIIRIDTFVVRDGETVSVSPRPDTSDPDTARFSAMQEAAGAGAGGGGVGWRVPGWSLCPIRAAAAWRTGAPARRCRSRWRAYWRRRPCWVAWEFDA